MEKEIKCPYCQDGTLAPLTKREMMKLKDKDWHEKYPEKIYGCDECKYWCDAEEVE